MSANDIVESEPASGHKHGQVCYLQIPALDLMTSALFYEKIFGWQIERPYPAFRGTWPDRSMGNRQGACPPQPAC